MSSLLASGLLVFVGSTLIKKALTTGSLLALTSGFLFEMVLVGRHLEAIGLILPQFVDRPLLILVGAFRAGASPKKNGPPGQFWRQQASGLLIFKKCLLEPFLIAKGTTNIGQGIEF